MSFYSLEIMLLTHEKKDFWGFFRENVNPFAENNQRMEEGQVKPYVFNVEISFFISHQSVAKTTYRPAACSV